MSESWTGCPNLVHTYPGWWKPKFCRQGNESVGLSSLSLSKNTTESRGGVVIFIQRPLCFPRVPETMGGQSTICHGKSGLLKKCYFYFLVQNVILIFDILIFFFHFKICCFNVWEMVFRLTFVYRAVGKFYWSTIKKNLYAVCGIMV